MKIIYQQNPLANKVVLDETEKRLLFWRYLVDTRVSDSLFDISCMIEKVKNNIFTKNLEEIYKNIKNIENFVDEAEYSEEKIEPFIDALQSSHFGDCVNQCNTCSKCYAEDKLDISSMPNYPWKDHIGPSLFEAFNQKVDSDFKNVSIDEAMDFLGSNPYDKSKIEKTHKITALEAQSLIDQWITKNNKAKEYLIYYKNFLTL